MSVPSGNTSFPPSFLCSAMNCLAVVHRQATRHCPTFFWCVNGCRSHYNFWMWFFVIYVVWLIL